jgi:membrane protein implicated in regulation of membrane protease activity
MIRRLEKIYQNVTTAGEFALVLGWCLFGIVLVLLLGRTGLYVLAALFFPFLIASIIALVRLNNRRLRGRDEDEKP